MTVCGKVTVTVERTEGRLTVIGACMYLIAADRPFAPPPVKKGPHKKGPDRSE